MQPLETTPTSTPPCNPWMPLLEQFTDEANRLGIASTCERLIVGT